MALVKYNNNSISAITTAGTMSANMVLIKEQTASSSASISFVDGSGGVVLDSTYPIYKIEFINIHASVDDSALEIQASTDGGSSYGVTKTTSYFTAFHGEGDGGGTLTYYTGQDLAQSTSSQNITHYQGNDNDQAGSGYIYIFSPSSTTFVKHFMTKHNESTVHDYSVSNHVAGYWNTTSALNGFKFFMSNGNIDSGTLKLYGIKDS